MDSDEGNGCSHPLGFPIRKSPDHSLLAASRGLSQLTTSFFAFLRLGLHTHALSSLTIKSTSHTTPGPAPSPPSPSFPTSPCPSTFPLSFQRSSPLPDGASTFS